MRGSGRQRARPERPAPEGLARTAQRGAGLPLPGPAGSRRDQRLPQLPAEGSSSARTVEESAPTVWPHGNSEEEEGGGKGTCTERGAKRVHIAYFMLQIALKIEQELEYKGCAFLSWQRRTN